MSNPTFDLRERGEVPVGVVVAISDVGNVSNPLQEQGVGPQPHPIHINPNGVIQQQPWIPTQQQQLGVPPAPMNGGVILQQPLIVPAENGVFANPQQHQQQQQQGMIQPLQNNNGFWKSNLFDCVRDEETCWWGLWCCWLLQARTTDSFELGSTKLQIMYFWGYIIGILVFIVIGGLPLGILFAIAGSIGLACNRAITRSQIRVKQGIPGTITDDFCLHCCCTCCTVCQEAREGKASALRSLDFCSGEPLEYQELAHERAVGRGNGVNIETATPAIPEGGNIITHIAALSKTSKIILILSAAVASLCFLIEIIRGNGMNILVLLLVFVQPIAILYFVYWRKRRQNATLDFVVKLFAVGFWFTTFQSAVIELILQALFALLLVPLFGKDILPVTMPPGGGGGGGVPPQTDDGLPTAATMSMNMRGASAAAAAAAHFPVHSSSYSTSATTATVTGAVTGHLRKGLLQLAGNIFTLSSALDGDHGKRGYSSQSDNGYHGYGGGASSFGGFGTAYHNIYSRNHNSAYHGYYHNSGDLTQQQDDAGGSNSGGGVVGLAAAAAETQQKVMMKKHIVAIIIGLLLMAYVVAAGVEETMKHFVVRCCSFPSPLKDPHAVLVYLMAGALGFATAENIEYVFGSSILVDELVTLLARVFMPVHVICSVLQAANLSKVLMGQAQMGLFQILLPAILLHGTFDFVLFLLGTVEFIYAEEQSLAFEISSLVIAVLITIGGAVWAYKSFKKVQTDFENGWRSFPTEEDDAAIAQQLP